MKTLPLALVLLLAAAGCQSAEAPAPVPSPPEASEPLVAAPEAEPSRTGGAETVAAMEGTWRSTDDPLNVIRVEDGVMASIYDGEELDRLPVRAVRSCDDLTEDPTSPVFVIGDEDPLCYEMDAVDATTLAYIYSARGNRLAYERVAE